VALRLKRNGIHRVRPLAGGLPLWMEREFPVEELPATARRADAARAAEGA